jgi:hypothetical protein
MRRSATACALLVLVAACSQSDRAQTTQAVDEGTGTSAADAALLPLAAPPADCRSRAPRSTPPGFPIAVIGREPLWMGVYAPMSGEALRLPPDTPYTEHGWRVKVLWLAPVEYPHRITVESLRVDEGDPALIQLVTVPRKRIVLDPANPGAYSNPKTADFPSSVYFPEAGCYAFDAVWPGGSWRVVLAVGA